MKDSLRASAVELARGSRWLVAAEQPGRILAAREEDIIDGVVLGSAMGLVIDTASGEAWEVPAYSAVARGYWQEVKEPYPLTALPGKVWLWSGPRPEIEEPEETPRALTRDERDQLLTEAVMSVPLERSKVDRFPEADAYREQIGREAREMMAQGIMPVHPKD